MEEDHCINPPNTNFDLDNSSSTMDLRKYKTLPDPEKITAPQNNQSVDLQIENLIEIESPTELGY